MTLRAAITQALAENKDIDHGASSGPCVRIGAAVMKELLDELDRAQICQPGAGRIRAILDGPERANLRLVQRRQRVEQRAG